jgi:predicted dehydrogenase
VAARVRVALVGCGRIARVHRAYLGALPAVELTGVWDSDPDARAGFARDTRAAEFATLEELIERGRPDVVHVLTPPQSHAALAVRLLDGGANVLVEKPFAMNAAEADRMIAAAERNRRWLTADHNRYFDPVVQQAAHAVSSGRLGRIVGVDVFQGAEAGEQQKGNHWSAQLPGGSLHNLASHPLYLMRRFAGPVHDLRVAAHVSDGKTLEEARLVAVGEHALASVTMSVATRPFTNRLTLYGTKATIEVNLNNMTLIERRPRALPKLLAKVWPNVSEASQLLWATARNGVAFAAGRQRFYPGIGAHLKALYARVAAGEAPPVTVEEARDVVAWYDEILEQTAIGTAGYAKAVSA